LCTRAITQLLMLLTKSITVSSSTNPILFKGIEDILNRTYDPPITGKITLYNSESEFSYEVDNNKVIDVVLNDSKQSFSTYAPPIYLSTRTRLISNLNGYLKIAAKSKTE